MRRLRLRVPKQQEEQQWSLSNSCARDSKSNALLKPGLRSKNMREEEKLRPGKIKMLTSKGNLNHDQKDSRIESSPDSVADKCWEENKKYITVST